MSASIPKLKQRKKARQLAMQALYQWHFSQLSAKELILQFLDNCDSNKIDVDYFTDAINKSIMNKDTIEQTLAEYLDREIAQLNPVELAVLRLAMYELLYRPDIPCRVVINEAVKLEKDFGSADGYKYVNGVLDAAAKKLRTVENQ
jgi:transcription antitermination protein NusB